LSLFFIVFGITIAIHFGSVFYGRNKLLSMITPAIAASLTTLIMYIGEMMLMGGELFKYGSGFLFKPVGTIPFSAADFIIILVSGAITYIISHIFSVTQKKE
jgi:branched-subunit amino acid transport protein